MHGPKNKTGIISLSKKTAVSSGGLLPSFCDYFV